MTLQVAFKFKTMGLHPEVSAIRVLAVRKDFPGRAHEYKQSNCVFSDKKKMYSLFLGLPLGEINSFLFTYVNDNYNLSGTPI